MQKPIFALLLLSALRVPAADPITYDNLPLGKDTAPLILRTYVPDPGLDDGYFVHHGKAAKSPKYNPGTGMDVKGEYDPVKGLPAAVAVSHGPALSYVFDTVECRIAYAWQGGFLDMYPYWGDQKRGNRLSYDYVPRLVGTLFHLAAPMSEIHVDGKRLTDLEAPKYIGYDLQKGMPTFLFSRGGHQFSLKVVPETKSPLSLTFTLSSPDVVKITYGSPDGGNAGASLTHTIKGSNIGTFQGYPRDMKITKATIDNGRLLYDSLGCSACHSIDGSLGHGPSLGGLYGSDVELEGVNEPAKADAAYILESIKAPGAKTVKGFPPNYMPPYVLKDLEYQSLVLFIESVAKGE